MLPTVLFVLMAAGPNQDRDHEPAPLQVVFLRKGPQHGARGAIQDASAVAAAHQAFLAGLSRQRVNLLYGPFLDDGDPRGIAVLDVRDEQEALSLMSGDPHIKAGHLAVDVEPWNGPRGAFHPPSGYDIAKPGALARFVIGFFADGPDRAQPDDEAGALDRAHHAHLAQLQRQRKVAVFGDFVAGSGLRGLVVFRVETVEEARELARTDPAVEAGRLVLEARPFMTLAGTLGRP